MREPKRAGGTAEGRHKGNGKVGGKLGRETTGAAERARLGTRRGWPGMVQRGAGECGQGVNTRPVQADEARTRTGRKVWSDVKERGIPAPRAARGTRGRWQGQRGLSLHPCLHAAGRGPGSCVDRARDRGCPRGSAGQRAGSRHSAPLRRARLRACVRVRAREAPTRGGPVSPPGLCAAPRHGGSRRVSPCPGSPAARTRQES